MRLKAKNRQEFLLAIFLAIFVFAISEASTSNWQELSVENANLLILSSELTLPSSISGESIEFIYLIPNKPILFIRISNDSIDKDTWYLWDKDRNQALLELQTTKIKYVKISPNGNFLTITTENADNRAVTDTCIWSLEFTEQLNCWLTPITVDLQFTLDEKILILPLAEKQVIGWNLQEKATQFTIPLDIVSIAITPDDKYVILDETDAISIWDIYTETPSEIYRYILPNKVIVEKITLDLLGQYLFFNTISITESGEIELGILDIIFNSVEYVQREVIPRDFFSRFQIRLFLFKQPDTRSIAEIINPITHESYGTIKVSTLRDYTLAQDIFIARDEAEDGFIWSVKNFETQEILFTLYENADDTLMDVRFTQDERFIIAYTEDGLVQLWGVPAEG
jgi:WD40 repeat protein